MRVAIIGGGIAGLAAAYYLRAADAEIELTLIERQRVGGKIVSELSAGFVIEGGPDSVLAAKPAVRELCQALGIEDQLIGAIPGRKAQIWSRRRMHPIPDGLMMMVPTKVGPFLRSRLFSWPGKLRMGLELLVRRRRATTDESLASFVRRRLGNEALEKLAQPLVAGIYMADAEKLSMECALPQMAELERNEGSIVRPMLRRAPKSGGPAPFMSLQGGMQTLIDALTKHLQSTVRIVQDGAATVRREGEGYCITHESGATLIVDAVVLATPAWASAELVAALEPKLAEALRSIRYVSSASVALGYREVELREPLNGTGFVVPRAERRAIRACTWLSSKFAGRAPEGHVLLRCFFGGDGEERWLEADDDALIKAARQELRDTMGITAAPMLTRVFRWQRAAPQYDVGHRERVAAIEGAAAALEGLALAGSAYRGVSVPDCIRDGERAAKLILARKNHAYSH